MCNLPLPRRYTTTYSATISNAWKVGGCLQGTRVLNRAAASPPGHSALTPPALHFWPAPGPIGLASRPVFSLPACSAALQGSLTYYYMRCVGHWSLATQAGCAGRDALLLCPTLSCRCHHPAIASYALHVSARLPRLGCQAHACCCPGHASLRRCYYVCKGQPLQAQDRAGSSFTLVSWQARTCLGSLWRGDRQPAPCRSRGKPAKAASLPLHAQAGSLKRKSLAAPNFPCRMSPSQPLPRRRRRLRHRPHRHPRQSEHAACRNPSSKTPRLAPESNMLLALAANTWPSF